jgi:isoleucyl-tRNA synthetase
LDANGYVSSEIPELKGMFYKHYKNQDKNDSEKLDLNTWTVMELKKSGNYYDKRQIKHNYPFCWRSDTPLIYRATSSWFVKVEDMQDKLLELNSKINWYPDHVGSGRFASWLRSAKDWGVSRSRFWGTPIPVWKSEDGDIICPSSSYELEKLAGLEPNSITDLHRHKIDDIEIHQNGKVYRRITDVFDCWFESGSMPYGSIARVGIVELLMNSDTGIQQENGSPYIVTKDGIKHNILPADFIAEGLDQTRGWFYTLLVLSASLFNQIPFKNVIVNGLILAEDGKKMSKRLKNYPDPMDIVKSYGSDVLRLYLLGSVATKGEPLKFSEQGVRDVNKDVIIPLSHSIAFLKEYVTVYTSQHGTSPIYDISEDTSKLSNPINIWILKKYSELRSNYSECMNKYDLKGAVSQVHKLVEILNNGYIKLGRSYLKGKQDNSLSEESDNVKSVWEESLSTLYYILKFISLDFRAIMPFLCETYYQKLNEMFTFEDAEESIHLVDATEINYLTIPEELSVLAVDFDIIYNIIFTIYQMRGSYNLSMKKPVKNITIVVSDEFSNKYSDRYRNYLDFVSNECNILDITLLNEKQIEIKKTITANRNQFFSI